MRVIRQSRWIGRLLAVVLALAAGAAISSAGLSKQQRAVDARGRDSAIALVGVLGELIDPSQRLADVKIYNVGGRPVHVGEAIVRLPGFTDPPAMPQDVREPNRRVEPGSWSRLRPVIGEQTCATRSPAGDPVLAVRVMPPDGSITVVEVPLLDLGGVLRDMTAWRCGSVFQPERAVNAWQETSTLNDDATVTLELHVQNYGTKPVEVVAVRSALDLDIRVLKVLPATVEPDGLVAIDVHVQAADCLAVVAGTELQVTTRYGMQTATLPIWVQPTTSPQLIADQGCDGPL